MSTATMVWRQYRLERRMFWRNPSAAFFNFLLPLVFLFLLGAVFSSNQRELDRVIPGIAGMSVMATTFTALAYNITNLREQGILKRIHGTPLSGPAYLGGVALNAVTNCAVQIAIVILAGKLLFGLPWPPDVGELIVFVLAGVACFAPLGVALSHVIPNFESATAYVNGVFIPILIISFVAQDVTHVPAMIRDVADALPLKPTIDGLTGGLVTGRGLGHDAAALGVIMLWAVIGWFPAVRGFSWEARSY
jgi:ABC-2 type transport system permease protein